MVLFKNSFVDFFGMVLYKKLKLLIWIVYKEFFER